MSILLSSVSSCLRLVCLSAQQFLIYFQAGDPSWFSPFSGFWTRFSEKPWGNMAKSGLFLWAVRWRERLATLCSPLTHRASVEPERNLRLRASWPPFLKETVDLLRKPGTRGFLCSLSVSSRPYHAPSVIIYIHTFLFPLDWKVL